MSAFLLPAWHERLLATWRSPASFTALLPVRPGDEAELRATVARFAPRIEAALPGVEDLHSFRLVVVPADAPGMTRTHLLVNFVHDRPLDEHLAAWQAALGPVLGEMLTTVGAVGATEEWPEVLGRHRVRENTVHLGAIGKSVADIRRERALRETIGEFVDQALAAGNWTSDTSAETVRRDVRDYVRARGAAAGLPEGPAAAVSAGGRALRFLDLLKTFAFPAIGVLRTDIGVAIRRIAERGRRDLARVAYAFWWLYGAIPTGLALLLVRVLERIEPDDVLPPADARKVANLEDAEDIRLKNEVTYWFAVRDSWIRRWLLAVILWGSERGCRHFWTDGKLAGIDTIHYARIMQLAGKRVMLFMSDYDGSLDRYLLDFTGVGSRAVIPIASNVTGSPKTRWLYGKQDPVTFGPRLVNLLRVYQLETTLWYNAFPQLTVRDVLVNAAIREGLFAPTLSEDEAQRWAGLL